MSLSAEQFARVLAERLADVLPRGCAVSPEGESLWLNTPDGYGSSAWAGGVDGEDNDAGDERYALAAWNVLSAVQDGVTRTLRAPWPRLPGSRLAMADPWARVADGVLHLGYGDDQNPVVRCRPITIDGR